MAREQTPHEPVLCSGLNRRTEAPAALAKGTGSVECREKQLEAAVAARDELIAAFGHELRNALAPLVLLAEQFEAKDSPRAHQERLTGMLSRHLRRLGAMVDRVGEVAQLREGKLELAVSCVDLGEVAGEVIGEMTGEAAAGGIEIRLDAEAGVQGQWDRARVKQIITALLSNAIRYSGSATIDVFVSGDGEARLIVRDHGRGIAAEQRSTIFDHFARSDQQGERKPGGFGIGLWVVKTLCKAMRGDVVLAEADEPGACFCVNLPRDSIRG